MYDSLSAGYIIAAGGGGGGGGGSSIAGTMVVMLTLRKVNGIWQVYERK